jgi:predicted phosphodiesterase
MAKKKKEKFDPETLKKVDIRDILREIQSRDYFVARTPLGKSGLTYDIDLKRWASGKFKFGVVADTHLCSKHQQLTALKAFYRLCQRRKIDIVLHCGDIVSGERMYRGWEYENFVFGGTSQRNYAVSHYPKVKGITTKIISGNHDQSFMKTSGYNVVQAICEQREDLHYLGDDLAFLNIENIKIALMHGRGGVAYARSYKSQKIVEQFSSENKPHFLFLGHYHVPSHIPGYRNVEVIQMSCFQSQTPYLVAKGLMPHVAGLIVTVQPDDSGMASVTYEWIPFYKHIKNDF